MKDKDFLKDQAIEKYSLMTGPYMAVPFALQIWQIRLANHEQHALMYSRVRMAKIGTFAAAMIGLGYEMTKLRKKMTYYDRFYPEATELQKTLLLEAQMYKEENFTPTSMEEKMAKVEDPQLRQIYSSMYRLAPQSDGAPDDMMNAGGEKKH